MVKYFWVLTCPWQHGPECHLFISAWQVTYKIITTCDSDSIKFYSQQQTNKSLLGLEGEI